MLIEARGQNRNKMILNTYYICKFYYQMLSKKSGALYSGHIKKEWRDVQCTHRRTCQQFWGENSLGHYLDNHPGMKAKCTLPIGDRRPSLGRNGIQWWANVLDLKRCRLESFLFCFFLKAKFFWASIFSMLQFSCLSK